MRILLWHGWLLEGSGSNVYTANVAEAYGRQGHHVLVLCQERRADRFPFVEATGVVGGDGISWDGPDAGRVRLLRPDIGTLLPVFVVDEYEGFHVKSFPALSDQELDGYLRRNVAALRRAAEWFDPDVVVTGHAVPGAVIARRALQGRPYVAKIHGSDLEYAVRIDRRYLDLAREGLEGAVAVTGPTRDALARARDFVPSIAGRTRVVPPGVEVELFRPRPRREAFLDVAARMATDPDLPRGRAEDLDREVRRALAGADAAALDGLARRYDQAVPDPGAPARLEALAEHAGPIVGYLGKLIPQKGIELLFQAAALLPDPPHLLVVGFGSFREWLSALTLALDEGDIESSRWLARASPLILELQSAQIAAARGFAGKASFTGRLDHRYAPAALAGMDILVVPSILHEAFGMVAAEGAAAGALPLVARHSGLAEVAEALEGAVGEPGIFSYEPGPGAVHRIAGAIGRLLAMQPARRNELRNAVSAIVAKEWTWERTADRLLEAARSGRPVDPRG